MWMISPARNFARRAECLLQRDFREFPLRAQFPGASNAVSRHDTDNAVG